jgi:hypothetical protein
MSYVGWGMFGSGADPLAGARNLCRSRASLVRKRATLQCEGFDSSLFRDA